MKKLAILVDSSCYEKTVILPKDTFMINLPLTMDGNDLGNVGGLELIDIMQANPKAQFLSSQPSPGKFLEKYSEIEDEYENLIFISISSKLSGTYQSALQAKELYEGKMNIYIYDSLALISYNHIMAQTALEMSANGKSIEEIFSQFDIMRSNMHVTVALETVENVKRSGRLSGAAAALATLVGIKPIIGLLDDGAIEAIGKARTFKKVLPLTIEKGMDKVNVVGNTTFYVLNLDNKDAEAAIIETLKTKYDVKDEQIVKYEISALLALHIGRGAAALMTFEK